MEPLSARARERAAHKQFNTWLRPLQAIERDGQAKVLVPNPYVIKWVGDNSLPRIKESVRPVRRRCRRSMWSSMWEPARWTAP